MVWSLETASGLPATPEARAALEARLSDRVKSIKHPSINKHYYQAFKEKLDSFFAPVRGNNSNWKNYKSGNQGGRKPGSWQKSGTGKSGRLNVSDGLRNSPLMQAGRAPDITKREAVILSALINHPRLVETQFERLADIDFESNSARRILSELIDFVTNRPQANGADVRDAVAKLGFEDELIRMKSVLRDVRIWQSGENIDESDAETGLNHALALHYKSVDLNKELKAAEIALGQEPSEESFERLRDIQNQITSVDGTEALIEGFGLLSGRATPSF